MFTCKFCFYIVRSKCPLCFFIVSLQLFRRNTLIEVILKSIRLHRDDNCVVLSQNVIKGDKLTDGNNIITISSDVLLGHKIATSLIQPGDDIYKYGVSIGKANLLIKQGDHVHLHNLKSSYLPTFTLSENKDIHDE